ncbi:EamA family transporter RarD [Rothia sp. P7181]|uniref:EamA family transporter RarD n=1 Tax=unclassified Rothia (in: high G+C Gram-positive bacteria) TaxID=2689056 RepID=UPI003ACB520D
MSSFSTQQTSTASHSSRTRSGLVSAIGAYLIWGTFPLYFALTLPATPYEIVSIRVLFSLLFCAVILCFIPHGYQKFWQVLSRPKTLLVLSAAALLIGANWLFYVIATTTGHTLDASLGYFINPLVNVLLGVFFLQERLRVLQWVAVGIAAIAVLVMSVLYGQIPWLGLGLAFTFAFYGLVKNKLGGKVPPIAAFTVETLALAPVAIVVLYVLWQQHHLTLLSEGTAHFWILAASGILTTLPLLLFADAASKLPLSLVGIIQYMTPTIQFFLAILVFGEQLTAERWIGFILVWIAVALFTADAIRSSRVRRRAVLKAV